MSEHTSRLLSLNEPAFAPLRRRDLASFLLLLSDGRVIVATEPCAALGVFEDKPAPASVQIIARHVAAGPGLAPRLERVRLPAAFVPRMFSCLALTTPLGPAVLFADPAAMAEAPPPQVPLPQDAAPQAPPSRPVRFTWEADGDGRLLSLSPSIVEALGPRLRTWQGRTFQQLADDGVLKDVARAMDLLQGGASFSDAVLWTGETPARRIEIGGVPLFDSARRRIGVRGFGLIWQATPGPPARERPPENVVPLRGGALSPRERSAFHEIARSLNEAIDGWTKPPRIVPPFEPAPVVQPEPPPQTPVTAPPADASVTESSARAAFPAEGPPKAESPLPPPSAPPPQPLPRPSWDDGLLDRLPIGLAVQQRGEIVHANETLLAWTGLPDLAAFRSAGGLERLLVRGADGRLELTSAGAPGRPVDVRLVSAPWRGGNAIIHSLRALEPAPPPPPPPVVIAPTPPPVDVDAERARARGEALDLIPFPVFLLDANGTIGELNAAASELSGFTARELAGEPFTLAFAPGSQMEAVALLDAAARGAVDGTPREGALRARHRLGIEREMDAVMGRTGQEPDRFCLILREPRTASHTEAPALVAAPAERRDGDPAASMDPFVRRVSHAVRVPLTSIMGFVDAVRRSSFGPVGNTRYAKHAEAAASAAQQLLETLEDIEALNACAPAETRENVRLSAALRLAIDHVEPMAKRRRILIRTDGPDDLEAWINAPVLAESLRILIEEALRATPAGGQVVISTRRDGGGPTDERSVILVRDGGRGLSEEEIGLALSPFRATAVSDRFAGSGRPFRMARLCALLAANGAELSLRRGVEEGMLCEIRLPR